MKQAERELRRELEDRLRFETLLSEISALLINLPSNQIDNWIEEAQRRICDFLHFDLSALWQWSTEAADMLILTHLYTVPGGPSRPEQLNAYEAFPWVTRQIIDGKLLALSTEHLGPEAAVDQQSLRYYGVKSSIVIPLSVGGGKPMGVVSFDTLHDERTSQPEIVKRLLLVAQIFSNALARMESDRVLRQSEARLSLAADSAEAGLWELDFSTNLFWVTERAKKIFGYDTEEVVSLERFEKSVHQEDLDAVRQVISRAFDRQEPFKIEYRILVGDGCIRWIYSCGRSSLDATGHPVRLLGASTDITRRKTFEAKIVERDERLSAAIEVAALGFYEMNGDCQFYYMDERFKKLIGVSPEEEPRARQFWLEHIHPEDLSGILELSRQILEKGGDMTETEYRYHHPVEGTIWLRHHSQVFERDSVGKASRVVGVMRNVTGRRQTENMLRETEENLKSNQRDLQRLAGKLISVKEEELRRLSRELHDGLTQRLAVIAIEAGKMEQQMKEFKDVLPGDPVKNISHIKEQLINISEDVHRISRQLHPTILSDLGLVRAIESECALLQFREKIDIIFREKEVPIRIPEETSLCIYRIVQEGLKNIISHSRATRCEIILRAADDMLFLVIKDDGLGFDFARVRYKAGLGLSSMRERVQLVRGEFSINSRPGLGTAISVSIPLKQVYK